jgi:hypothetical protein
MKSLHTARERSYDRPRIPLFNEASPHDTEGPLGRLSGDTCRGSLDTSFGVLYPKLIGFRYAVGVSTGLYSRIRDSNAGMASATGCEWNWAMRATF